MHDIATIAALEWARTNSRHGEDPSTFGANVAKAYFACRDAKPVSAAELEAAQQIDAMYQAMQSARIEVKPPDAAIDLVRCAGFSGPAPSDGPPDSEAGESGLLETPRRPRPPDSPDAGAQPHPRSNGEVPQYPAPSTGAAQGEAE